MKPDRISALISIGIFALAGMACGPKPPDGPVAASVFLNFQSPPAEYRSAPLWVWNDRITVEQIDGQMADFKAKGIGGLFVHPRPGLITPYLSEEWLALFTRAVETGRKLGLKVWIYDENSYPSGFAGGHVPAALPEAVRSGLRMKKADAPPRPADPAPLLVLRRTGNGFEDVTARLGSEAFGPGDYRVFDIVRQKPSPWYGGFTYVDLLRPEVTAKFLELTLEPYRRAFGADFGGVVPGVFQDEAEINPPGGDGFPTINWTPRLFEAFSTKWGYDLRPHLPAVFDGGPGGESVRHDFYALLLDLFMEGWAKPYFAYCETNKLAFTGHYWEHEWPRPVVNPDNLAFAAWAHMPGIDILMNDFARNRSAQFGNARAVREIRSAANQTGRIRTMSETYGAGGWDLTFFDQKRIADWQFALGVNFVNQHLSYVTLMGARKRDHPQSFSYHEPWWPYYGVMADYLGRLSVAMSAGRQENRVLVLEPTTTAWMFYSPAGDRSGWESVGDVFQNFVNGLEAAQVEYDLGSEDTLKNLGRVEGRTLALGKQAYDLVILPPGMKNIEAASARLLKEFLAAGGRVLAYGAPPEFIDGRSSGDFRPSAENAAKGGMIVSEETGPGKIFEILPPEYEFSVHPAEGAENLLFHHRRSLADGDLVFLANTDPANGVSGSIASAKFSRAESWDAFEGTNAPYPTAEESGKALVSFDLPPGGSLLLCLKPGKGGKESFSESSAPRLLETAESAVSRLEPNVLTLDYCDLTMGGRTEKDLYFYDAQLRTYKAHGLGCNPWDSAVQYRTNILDLDRFPAGSGFSAAFHFEAVPGTETASIQAVVERPHLFKVSVNGRPVEPKAGAWWLDKAFGVFDVGPHLRPGRNTIVLKAAPFTIHSELESIYLRGDFGLEPAKKGFRLVPAADLSIGSWKSRGMPFYGQTVAYGKSLNLPSAPAAGERYEVELGSWTGASAEVRVNGVSAGLIAFAPFRREITKLLTAGENRIEVVVCGTLKNTLGPFHNNPRLGQAWPGQFQRGAGDGRPSGSEYSQADYGLFEDYRLVKR